jgi:hypothetical protein
MIIIARYQTRAASKPLCAAPCRWPLPTTPGAECEKCSVYLAYEATGDVPPLLGQPDFAEKLAEIREWQRKVEAEERQAAREWEKS